MSNYTLDNLRESMVKILKSDGEIAGSGFIIRTDGYLVTCHHVIYLLDALQVEYQKQIYAAQWCEEYSRPEKDIAILKINVEGAKAVPIINPQQLSISVTVYGFPPSQKKFFPDGINFDADKICRSAPVNILPTYATREIKYHNPWNRLPKENSTFLSYRIYTKVDAGTSGGAVLAEDLGGVVGVIQSSKSNESYVIRWDNISDELKLLKLEPNKNYEQQLLEDKNIAIQSIYLFKTNREFFLNPTTLEQRLIPPLPIPKLTTFDFELVTVDAQGIETKRCWQQAEYFIEKLSNDVVIEMVSIPGGKFQMGASLHEFEFLEDERPQHIVNIKSFFMGRYPITQAQWKVVANLPKINRDFNNSEPSYFNGDNLPVERVSWLEAWEFCQRLSRATGRIFRLPSEAEWEYACRAKTSTPFHFGKTITTDLANFCGQNENIHGVYRQQTTEVGSFPPNAFGLYDMHGNVWEWCADYDHEGYQDAPLDGSAWLEDGNEEYRILRGGSWQSPANLCRSASRFSGMASVNDREFGFRVVCSFL